MPDGKIARFEVAEGTTPEQAEAAFDEWKAGVNAAVSPAPTFSPEQIAKHVRKSSMSLDLGESKYQPTATEETLAGLPARLAYGLATPGLAALEMIPQTRGLAQRATSNFRELSDRGNLGVGKSGLSRLTGGAAEIAGVAAPYLAAPMLSGAKGVIPTIAQYLSNVGIGSGIGAVSGMMTPTGEVADFGAEKEKQVGIGAGIGGGVMAALPPAAKLASSAWKGGRNLMSGVEGQAQNYLSKIFGSQGDRSVAAQNLDALRPNVSGEAPTAGMAAVSGKSPLPAFKALEEGARGRQAASQEFAERDAQNEMARARVFEWISNPGKKPPAEHGGSVRLSPAEAFRANITKPLYKSAGEDMVVMDDTLNTILGGAQIQSAANRAGVSLRQAVTNAEVAGTKTPGVIQWGKKTPGYDLPEWSVAGPRTPDVTAPTKVSIDSLQRIRDAIDGDILPLINATNSEGKKELNQLRMARAQLDKWMRTSSPKYANAQDTYKELSQVQNQADVADVLLKALQTPAGVERYASFLAAMRNAGQTVKKAGVPRFEEIGQVLSPTQMRLTRDVAKSLEQEGKYAALKAPQSILPENRSTIDAIEKSTPGWLNQVITALRKGMSKVGGEMDEASTALVDKLMTDPRKMAAFMRKATPIERDAVAKYVAAGVGAAKPSTVIAATVSGAYQ
jgi:hypothetical protein